MEVAQPGHVFPVSVMGVSVHDTIHTTLEKYRPKHAKDDTVAIRQNCFKYTPREAEKFLLKLFLRMRPVMKPFKVAFMSLLRLS